MVIGSGTSEEDWGQDIHLEGQFFQKNGLYHLEPDKDLMLACERYLDNPYQSYCDDDDTNSSVYSYATGSFISSRYSAIDGDLAHIDEYMLNEKLPGTIQRLGRPRVQDSSDWFDDIQLPGMLPPQQKKDYVLDFDVDDIGPSISQRTTRKRYCYEPEDEGEDELEGLDFPETLELEHKLNEKKKSVYEPKQTSKIPVLMKSPLAHVHRERDDDDFLEGLDIKDPTLFTKKTAAKKPAPLISRLARPSKPVRAKPNFLSSTQSSLHREAEIRQQQQKIKQYTLISKPKTTRPVQYCTRLDTVDNLNDLTPKKKMQVTFNPKKKPVVERPWRQNKQKKLTLIQPNETTFKKEYNDMTFDEKTHQWKGNEKSLVGFQEKRKSRLMLMSPKNQTSKYAAMMGNNMIFKPELQKWVSALGHECNELDAIQDLEDGPKQPKREYYLSEEIKRNMLMEQEAHDQWYRHWPLDREPVYITASGHKVGASKYFLKLRLF